MAEWVDEFGVTLSNDGWKEQSHIHADDSTIVDDVDAALLATEILLDRYPDLFSASSIDTYFSHDIHNRAAQGILNRAVTAVHKLSAQARRELASAMKQSSTGKAILNWLDKYRVGIARLLTSTQLASVLEGAREVATKVPPLGAVPLEGLPVAEQERIISVSNAAPAISLERPEPGEPEELHFPIIEEAVKSLAERRVMTRPDFDALEAAARAKAFTVANVQAQETLTKIRDSLSNNIREGVDYGAWSEKVLDEVESGTFLSPAHQETVFRTNVQTAFSDGQMSVLQHPLIRSGFPYADYDAIHDGRVREDHLALEKHGIGGTNTYRVDDPVFQLFRPPWDYNDRCSWTPKTVQAAAEAGIEEAKKWLETGVEPYPPAHVDMPPFQPPPGFQRSLSGAPLSIRLSLEPMIFFGHKDQPRNELGEWVRDSDTREVEPERAELDVARRLELPTAYRGKQAYDLHRRKMHKLGTRNVVVDNPLPQSSIPPHEAGFLDDFRDEVDKRVFNIDELRTTQDWIRPTVVDAYIKNNGKTLRDDEEDGLPNIIDVNGELIVIDGTHRVLAAKLRGENTINATYSVVTDQAQEEMRSFLKNNPQAAKEMGFSVDAALSTDEDYDEHDERLQLIASILVLLYGDDAVDRAVELMEDGDIALAITPKTTIRYGKKPGPGWTPFGVTRKGVQRWVWGPNTAHRASPLPAPAPSPPPAALPPPPPPPPTPSSAGKYVSSHQQRSANATAAYNSAMATLQAGGNLTQAQMQALSAGLSVMSKGQLTALYAALGGNAAITGSQRQPWVHAIKGILAGTPAAPAVPSPPPPAPTPSPLHKGANVITGAPAAAVTVGAIPPPVPDYYQPPPPRLTPVAAYVDIHPGSRSGGLSNSTTMKTSIDYSDVDNFDKKVSSLSADFSNPLNPSFSTITQLDHNPSGYKVLASWLSGMPPPPGQTGSYIIHVLDGTGKIASTYSSPAPRDQKYVAERAVQVAHWMESEVNRIAKLGTGGTTSPHLAQFAYEYAQAAGIKPKTVAFSISNADAGDTSNRQKMDAYLKTDFPKLIGARQHGPHGGMDTIEHTMNILNPANLRTAGLPARDAELLRLGMLYHDVGKQHDPLDHEHPRKSAQDAEPLLWQYGLTPEEVSDTLAVIKWHDAYGDAMQDGSTSAVAKVARLAYEYTRGTDRVSRTKEAHRINDLLMRAWQSDVSSIPGLTADPIPGRPDVKVTGFLQVDKAGPNFMAKVAAEIDSMAHGGSIPTAGALPKKPPTVTVGTTPPKLVAKGKKWGEIVQRDKEFLVGQPVPHGAAKVPPKEVYDEARKNPELNYARAFNMSYDGPTGDVIDVYHGISNNFDVVGPGILNTGIRAGNGGDNVYGHGVYTVVNGADSVPRNYGGGGTVQLELHTGRTISHDDLTNKIVPAWKKANPGDAKKLQYSSVEGELTAAALWAGYSTIAVSYNSNSPTLVILDPARVRVKQVVESRSNKYKGRSIKTANGTVTSKTLKANEVSTPSGSPNYVKVKGGVPQTWDGTARTS